ncbi:glycosyltransferase family 4 protein [Ferrimicrobium acidiphilum]|uniref:GDP-mannose-dependent alpha-(1-2)-phosphatidylinositol mannosyltransferase n=1 Tax=Ferrimicrobium acidiphilum DSM 19497 TaxID=1121877 RepID=A0A0D8FXF3_9ACTN|nr:glycosyltransferase family 4 protein [Ferrimicrobium acidiphilum]KJE77895.1 GDP-mannose-dependent alpha-(1-2)-phosphatidylinositol mannosyltransferase [Ferrimicrobium acidiphilum DSM 19497]
MKVVEVSPYDLGVAGGVQAQVLGIANSLRSLGCEVKVLAAGSGNGADYSLGRTSSWRANGSIAPVVLLPRTRRLTPVLQWADVIHVHEPLTPMGGVSILRWAYLRGELDRLWVTFHRDGVSKGYQHWSHWWSYLLPPVDHRIAVSPFAANTAEMVTASRPSQIPNGVEIKDRSERETMDRLGRQHRVPRVLFVGRHEERKGLEVALRALELMPAEIELMVVGTGPLTVSLQHHYRDHRVRWLGAVDQAELAELYRSADALVAPSIGGESFGVVLLEAMAAGAPIAASDIPAYRWLTSDGDSAALFRPGDSEALARLLTELLEDASLQARLRDRGYARVRSFSFAEIGKRYLTLFEAT